MTEITRALSIAQAAKAASIGRTVLYEEIRKGHLIARKVGRRTIIIADDLDAWLKSLPASGGVAGSRTDGKSAGDRDV
jgi:excisionase family DNA binding protein